MEDNKDTTAFLIFKDTKQYINQLTDEETGKLFKAIFEYTETKEIPKNLKRDIYFCFLAFKQIIDTNEQRYKERCERNQKYYQQRQEKKESNKDKPTQNKPPRATGCPPTPKQPQNNKTPEKAPNGKKRALKSITKAPQTTEQTKFIADFQENCPSKDIDCQIVEQPKVNYEKLMEEIKQSQFLLTSNNLGLKWCLENSKKIINGDYRNYKNNQAPDKPTQESQLVRAAKSLGVAYE